MKWSLSTLALGLLGAAPAAAEGGKPELTVHIVPHTHDDVGWLKTVDQYFYGANNTIQHANVQMILSTLIPALEYDEARKFTYVEQAFFTRWYNEQNAKMKGRVAALVDNGQLAFVNGGWCMHDEAATHFMGMIDQTTLGHNFLKETFDYKPTVGWQIDPFGHSSTQASLLSAEAGFDALYFGRIDYQDLNLRRDERRVEGIWRASANQQEDAEVFWGLTGSYGGNYGPPSGFCYDNFCDDEPMMDDPALTQYNVGERVSSFVAAAYDQANQARGSHIMMTMGSDFQYENSEVWFRNLDSLIKNVNEYAAKGDIEEDPNANFGSLKLVYSNPEIYTKAKHEDDLKWEVKTDDFFPYSDCEQCFWTGYFTSRAELKKWERTGSAFLQAARQIEAFDTSAAPPQSTFDSPTHDLDAAVGVVQHHDGVSGTAKQHVADDYAWRIDRGFKEAASYMAGVLKRAMLKPDSPLEFTVCQGLNVSVCDASHEATAAGDDLVVVAYNALSHERTEVVAVPVASDDVDYTVTMYPENVIVASSVSATVDTLDDSASPFKLNIEAQQIPPMGAKTFVVSQGAKKTPEPVASATATSRRNLRSPITIANEHTTVSFDSNGNMQAIGDQKVTQDWGYYTSFDSDRASRTDAELGLVKPHVTPEFLQYTPGVSGTCLPGYLDQEGAEDRWLRESDGQNSGAYIFRPSTKDEPLNLLPSSSASSVSVVEGELVTEVHATFGDWVKQTTRLVKNQPFVEIEWTVGPVPIDDAVGKEVVTRFNTPIDSGDTFFTDSNGREFLERKIDYRPTWDLEVFQPIAGNYYPVGAAIFIEDDESSFAVMNDRTQGGASLSSGSVEIMVQRRIVADDSRGVGEPLDETTGGVTPYPPYGEAERVGDGVIIKGVHRIAVGAGKSGASTARGIMDETFSPLNLFFTSVPKGTDFQADHVLQAHFRNVAAVLPKQISMITLSKVNGEPGSFFVRLAHQYGEGEDAELSKPAKVDMNEVLPKGMKMKAWKEMTLSGNQGRKEMEENRLKWKPEDELEGARAEGREMDNGDVVTIKPMEIRSFKIVTENKNLGWAQQ